MERERLSHRLEVDAVLAARSFLKALSCRLATPSIFLLTWQERRVSVSGTHVG